LDYSPTACIRRDFYSDDAHQPDNHDVFIDVEHQPDNVCINCDSYLDNVSQPMGVSMGQRGYGFKAPEASSTCKA